jgi:hypothetical protein
MFTRHIHAKTPEWLYPLKVSSNKRYLVDQRGRPFMVVGDSPQALIGNLSLKDAAAYIANRQASGFNSLIVDVLCAKYTGCRPDGTTLDGVAPFEIAGDLSTPNPAYFARVDAVVRLAAKSDIALFLDQISLGLTSERNGVGRIRVRRISRRAIQALREHRLAQWQRLSVVEKQRGRCGCSCGREGDRVG